jgi:hypothetical protein
MVAPNGATLTEVLEEKRFLRSIESVGSWFKYAEEEQYRCFKSLILVTGVIKCRSWSVAAISNASRTNSGKVTLSRMPATSGTLTASHTWGEYLPNMGHSGPTPPSQTENQCVFVRGYRIMKQDPLLRLVKTVKATDLQKGSTEYYRLGKPASSRGTSVPEWQGHSAGLTQLPSTKRTVVPGGMTSSDIDGSDKYIVERLSDADEVCSSLLLHCFI